MAFFTIEPAPGLTRTVRRRVARVGPPSVLARSPYESMLARAGFEPISVMDVTVEYRRAQQGWIEAFDRRREALIGIIPTKEFETRQRERRATVRAIDDGILVRRRYLARRPG